MAQGDLKGQPLRKQRGEGESNDLAGWTGPESAGFRTAGDNQTESGRVWQGALASIHRALG